MNCLRCWCKFLSPYLIFLSPAMMGSAIYKFQIIQNLRIQLERQILLNLTMSRTLAIAPMIQYTNTHFRSFARMLTKKATLYTEMIHANGIIYNHQKLLPFQKVQHPIVLQLGGSCPDDLFKAAEIGARYGYDAINLNLGCPSPKVQQNFFGAVLMKDPQLVKKCVKAISEGGKIPVSVKCRLGVDDDDSYDFLREFVSTVSDSNNFPLIHFIVHARKAFLNGLSPLQNRTIPPLIYQRVFRLKKEFPLFRVQLNGGIKSIEEGLALTSENGLDGCMVGRLALDDPFQLSKIDKLFYRQPNQPAVINDPTLMRQEILFNYADYLQRLQKNQIRDQQGRPIHPSSKFVYFKPILNLYKRQINGRRFRNRLSDMRTIKETASYDILRGLAQQMTHQTFKIRSQINQHKETTQHRHNFLFQQTNS